MRSWKIGRKTGKPLSRRAVVSGELPEFLLGMLETIRLK
jgi:hypothetical protein